MAIAGPSVVESLPQSIPATMQAAVYRGVNDVRLETVPVPAIGPGEMLVRVHSCGVCGTDLKKISTGSHSAPRIFGHETSGIVAAVGEKVQQLPPWRSRHGLPPHSVSPVFLLSEQDVRPVRHVQESRLHRWIRAFWRGFRRIRSRHGLDRRARHRPHSRRRFLRAGLLRRARQHLYEGHRGPPPSPRRESSG